VSESTTDAGLRERLLAALDADAQRPRGERVGLVNAMLTVAEQHVADERAKTLNEVQIHLDEIFSDWDRLNVPQVAATYELLRRMAACDGVEPECGVEGCDGDCDAAEVMELAEELAEERTLHQATIAERDRLRAKLARSEQGRRNLRELLNHHRDMGPLGMRQQHRNRLDRALRACVRYRADRDRLATELAEAKLDADRGWADAEKRQKECEEWAATCKRLMADNKLLHAALAHGKEAPEGQTLACGAVATTVSGNLGPCTGGWHHPSWPHKDASGARWQVLVLPEGAEPDDITARLAAAYYTRFDNNGHPEDSTTAAEVAMTVLGPELDRLTRKLTATARVRDDAIGALDTMQIDRDRLAAEVEALRTEAAKMRAFLGKLRERNAKNFGDAQKLRRWLKEEKEETQAHFEEALEAQTKLDTVRAECDRIETAVRANPKSPDFDGAYLSCLRHIRAVLDGTGEASC
jgi:hypothetical protein